MQIYFLIVHENEDAQRIGARTFKNIVNLHFDAQNSHVRFYMHLLFMDWSKRKILHFDLHATSHQILL